MSEQSSDNNNRIAKNTLLLYFRMLFMMAVTLYTSRVVLNTLGVEDYGIYNVVGGVVSMAGSIVARTLPGCRTVGAALSWSPLWQARHRRCASWPLTARWPNAACPMPTRRAWRCTSSSRAPAGEPPYAHRPSSLPTVWHSPSCTRGA